MNGERVEKKYVHQLYLIHFDKSIIFQLFVEKKYYYYSLSCYFVRKKMNKIYNYMNNNNYYSINVEFLII